MLFMGLTLLGLYCVCLLVSVVPHLVRKLLCTAGHRSRSDLEEAVTSGLLYSVTLGLT